MKYSLFRHVPSKWHFNSDHSVLQQCHYWGHLQIHPLHFHNEIFTVAKTFRMLLRINYWWFGISRKLLWSHLLTFTKKYWCLQKVPEAAWIHYWWFGIFRRLPWTHLQWNLQINCREAIYNTFTCLIHFKSLRSFANPHLYTFKTKYWWCRKLPEAAVTPVLIV